MTRKKKAYFPNNWKQYAQAPDSWFLPIEYEEFTNWKLAGWELPSSVACLIRVTDLKSKKTKEHIYRKPGCARNKIDRLLDQGGVEITVCDAAQIHHFSHDNFNEQYD